MCGISAVLSLTGYCPECGALWRGAPIPEESRELFGGSTHFSRLIGVEYQAMYDGVWEWLCPECGKTWPSEVQRLREP